MNCQRPLALALETANGFRADSMMAMAANSLGRPYESKMFSKIGR